MWSHGVLSAWESQACHWLHCAYGYFYQLTLLGGRNNRLGNCPKTFMQRNLGKSVRDILLVLKMIHQLLKRGGLDFMLIGGWVRVYGKQTCPSLFLPSVSENTVSLILWKSPVLKSQVTVHFNLLIATISFLGPATPTIRPDVDSLRISSGKIPISKRYYMYIKIDVNSLW